MLFYCLFQVAGAIIGASLLLLIRNVYEGSATLVFIGANSAVNAEVQTLETVLVGILAEVILTFVFIFTILGVTAKKEYGNFAGVIIGLCLTFVHLLGINITGTSVNPARSIGPAVIQAIAGEGTLPLQQIYIFILAPLAGAALAVLAFKCLNKEKPEHKQAA